MYSEETLCDRNGLHEGVCAYIALLVYASMISAMRKTCSSVPLRPTTCNPTGMLMKVETSSAGISCEVRAGDPGSHTSFIDLLVPVRQER